MRKMRSDSTWSQLTSAQLAEVERWRFDENLGFGKILERVRSKFALSASYWSLWRFCRRRHAERLQRAAMPNLLTPHELQRLETVLKSKAIRNCLAALPEGFLGLSNPTPTPDTPSDRENQL